MTRIDWETWPRREIFEHFSRCADPYYCVTFRQDVTALYEYCRARGLSFYLSLVWLCTKALDAVENFRYTLDGGRVALLDGRIPSFCDLDAESGLFRIVTLPAGDDMAAFCAAAKAKSAAQKAFLVPSEEGASLIYFSCVPWVDVTSLTNERSLGPDDNIPCVAWGRHVEENGRRMLGLSLEVNHRFVDGYHIGRFAEELSARIAALE